MQTQRRGFPYIDLSITLGKNVSTWMVIFQAKVMISQTIPHCICICMVYI